MVVIMITMKNGNIRRNKYLALTVVLFILLTALWLWARTHHVPSKMIIIVIITTIFVNGLHTTTIIMSSIRFFSPMFQIQNMYGRYICMMSIVFFSVISTRNMDYGWIGLLLVIVNYNY